jgi:hypothetical protein
MIPPFCYCKDVGQKARSGNQSRTTPHQWVMQPQKFQPGVAMPEMSVSPDDARRIAAFLERDH